MGDWRLGAKSFLLCAIFCTLLTIYLSIHRITEDVDLALLSQVMTIKFLLLALLIMLAAIFFALMDIGDQLRKGGQG